MRLRRLPVLSPPQLDAAPQPAISILAAVLDVALDSLTTSIAASHPELFDDSRPSWLPPIERHARLARVLLTHANRLRRTLRRYQRATRFDPTPDPPDDPNQTF